MFDGLLSSETERKLQLQRTIKWCVIKRNNVYAIINHIFQIYLSVTIRLRKQISEQLPAGWLCANWFYIRCKTAVIQCNAKGSHIRNQV
jgi:hypothetical protein